MQAISLSRLLEDQSGGATSPAYWVLGAIFLVLLFISLYVYLQASSRFVQDRLHRRLARRFAGLVGIWSGTAFGSAFFALLGVPFLSKRLWLVLSIAGLAATGAYGIFYLRRRYPAARLAQDDLERRQRYLPRPRSAARKRKARRR